MVAVEARVDAFLKNVLVLNYGKVLAFSNRIKLIGYLTEAQLEWFTFFKQVVNFFICSDWFVVQKDIDAVELGIFLETSILKLRNSCCWGYEKPGVAMSWHPETDSGGTYQILSRNGHWLADCSNIRIGSSL